MKSRAIFGRQPTRPGRLGPGGDYQEDRPERDPIPNPPRIIRVNDDLTDTEGSDEDALPEENAMEEDDDITPDLIEMFNRGVNSTWSNQIPPNIDGRRGMSYWYIGTEERAGAFASALSVRSQNQTRPMFPGPHVMFADGSGLIPRVFQHGSMSLFVTLAMRVMIMDGVTTLEVIPEDLVNETSFVSQLILGMMRHRTRVFNLVVNCMYSPPFTSEGACVLPPWFERLSRTQNWQNGSTIHVMTIRNYTGPVSTDLARRIPAGVRHLQFTIGDFVWPSRKWKEALSPDFARIAVIEFMHEKQLIGTWDRPVDLRWMIVGGPGFTGSDVTEIIHMVSRVFICNLDSTPVAMIHQIAHAIAQEKPNIVVLMMDVVSPTTLQIFAPFFQGIRGLVVDPAVPDFHLSLYRTPSNLITGLEANWFATDESISRKVYFTVKYVHALKAFGLAYKAVRSSPFSLSIEDCDFLQDGAGQNRGDVVSLARRIHADNYNGRLFSVDLSVVRANLPWSFYETLFTSRGEIARINTFILDGANLTFGNYAPLGAFLTNRRHVPDVLQFTRVPRSTDLQRDRTEFNQFCRHFAMWFGSIPPRAPVHAPRLCDFTVRFPLWYMLSGALSYGEIPTEWSDEQYERAIELKKRAFVQWYAQNGQLDRANMVFPEDGIVLLFIAVRFASWLRVFFAFNDTTYMVTQRHLL